MKISGVGCHHLIVKTHTQRLKVPSFLINLLKVAHAPNFNFDVAKISREIFLNVFYWIPIEMATWEHHTK